MADEQDWREQRVHATPQAARILDGGRAARVRVLANALRALGAGDLATLGQAAEIPREPQQQRRERPKAPAVAKAGTRRRAHPARQSRSSRSC